jgi:hypothetical protein
VPRWDDGWRQRLHKVLVDLAFQGPAARSAIRRELAKDPVAFALIYLRGHLRGDATGGQVTFSEAHYDWCRLAMRWRTPATEPQEDRHAFIAPRGCGKSTWWFLILPLWAAANGHVRFAAAFAHAGEQAQKHLQTLKRELDNNVLLRADYPDLCSARDGRAGVDTESVYQARSGFVFIAKGIDSASLGMKVDEHRPDLLILDDVEPDEASYSPKLAEKRLGTITDAVFQLNIYARVIMVGTVTMPGSIMHQAVKAAAGTETADWIRDERITAHHHRAIVANPDGSERSLWPEKWSLEYLASIRHTRSYAKNYDNDPMAAGGDFWAAEDFVYEELACTRWALSIDPSTTTGQRSDMCGIAVIGWKPPPRKDPHAEYAKFHAMAAYDERPYQDPVNPNGRCMVERAEEVMLVGEALREHVLRLLGLYPRIKLIIVEANQGGQHWHAILHHLPEGVKLVTVHNTEPKEVRAEWLLRQYQLRPPGVVHARKLIRCEERMVAFPKAEYDDIVDAVGTGVRRFLGPRKKAGIRTSSYAA